MQRHELLERVGEFCAMLGLAAAEPVLLQVQGVREMIDTGEQRAEEHPVLDHAADGDAAKADAVIATLAADQSSARALADGTLVGECHLERGVDRFRAGVGEEGMVEIAREQVRQLGGEGERLWVAPLEARREIELGGLRADRLHDPWRGVPGVAAPQAGRGVEQPAPIGHRVVHAFRTADQARMRLEMAVGGERHPERLEIVGRRLFTREHASSLREPRPLSAAASPRVNAGHFPNGRTAR